MPLNEGLADARGGRVRKSGLHPPPSERTRRCLTRTNVTSASGAWRRSRPARRTPTRSAAWWRPPYRYGRELATTSRPRAWPTTRPCALRRRSRATPTSTARSSSLRRRSRARPGTPRSGSGSSTTSSGSVERRRSDDLALPPSRSSPRRRPVCGGRRGRAAAGRAAAGLRADASPASARLAARLSPGSNAHQIVAPAAGSRWGRGDAVVRARAPLRLRVAPGRPGVVSQRRVTGSTAPRSAACRARYVALISAPASPSRPATTTFVDTSRGTWR